MNSRSSGWRDGRRGWPALAVWAATFGLLFLLDRHIELATGALLLVLGSALASPWGSPGRTLVASGLAVLAFDLAFVPPRGTWQVALHQHVLLLVTVLVVSWIVTLLVARQRALADAARAGERRSEQLRRFGEALRDAADLPSLLPRLRTELAEAAGFVQSVVVAIEIGPDAPPPDAPPPGCSADEIAGLVLCRDTGRPMGPGTGRHEEQPAWYLPLRGPSAVHGVALLRLPGVSDDAEPWPMPARDQAQALCDLMGAALDRAATREAARQADAAAQAQRLRNTLLAAIAHDHRTPLATILGAASSLHDQGERLDAAQRRRLAATIVDEATQLARLTDNTLQLARLDAPGLALRRDWESVEELVGTALRRVRARHPEAPLRSRLIGPLPLLRVDAVLLVQLLDNLLDNALRHGGPHRPVEVLARVAAERVVIAVRDRGPGVPPALRGRIFEPYARGDAGRGDPAGDGRHGAGLGLALCRSIARVHGGELVLRPRGHGGSSFELSLPMEAPT
ncbi:sensor histidine kinase [Leptothrix sp. BB-4]